MKLLTIPVLAAALFVSACGSTKVITVTESRQVAAKVDKDLFQIEKAPEPLVRDDFKGKTRSEERMLFSGKIMDLYGYIGTLQSQILLIQKTQDQIADRIEKETQK